MSETDPNPSTPPPRDAGASRQAPVPAGHRQALFAMIVMFGCVLGLPVLGALYVLFVRWGWLASPMAGH